MRRPKGRKAQCRRCGREIGEHGYSNSGTPSPHKCPHGVRCQTIGQCVQCDAQSTQSAAVKPTTARLERVRRDPASTVPSTLRMIAAELTQLETSRELLAAIFVELGPYQDGKITDETWAAVRDHVGFNDDE